jgi:hypothetical protein
MTTTRAPLWDQLAATSATVTLLRSTDNQASTRVALELRTRVGSGG